MSISGRWQKLAEHLILKGDDKIVLTDDEIQNIVGSTDNTRPYDIWWGELQDGPVKELLSEIYSSIVHANNRVAAMGLRALIEQIAVERAGAQTNSTFSAKVRALIDKGLVSARSGPVLEQVIELGHAAVHRGHNPHLVPLTKCMDIVDNVIESIYVLPESSQDIRRGTPKRPK
jgi:hypothetical protein